MKINRIISLNYKELVKVFAKLDEEHSCRTHGEFDLLRDNINKHLIQYLKGGFLIVQLDDHTGKAYICGEPIMVEGEMWDFPRIGCKRREERSPSEKIWFQLHHSLEESKLYNAYEKIFGAKGINDNEKNPNRKFQLRCERCNGYYTYSDENGDIFISLDCIAAWDFSEGLALVRKYNPDLDIMGHGFINTAGNFVIPLIWSDAKSFSEGMAAVANNKRDFGYIDKIGHLVIPCKYSTAGYFSDGLAPVWDNTICQGGYIDKTGRIIIPRKDEWSEICEFSEGLAPVRHKNGKWGYIDTFGKVGIPFLYEKAGSFGEGYAPVWDSKENCGYIDKTGKVVLPFNDKWKNASGFSEGLAPVKNRNELWGYIDKTGRLVIPFQWFEADQFEEGEAWVKPSGHYRLINKKGEYVFGNT